MWSLIFLMIILYKTQCGESTKPLEFLTALVSKCSEFANKHLIMGIEQAKEGEYTVYQPNVDEDSSNNEFNQQTSLGDDESTLTGTQNVETLIQNEEENTEIINEANSNINTDVHCEEVHEESTQLELDVNMSEKPIINGMKNKIENLKLFNDKLYNKLIFLKSKIEPLHRVLKILLEPVGQDSSILLKKNKIINSTTIELITTVKPITTSEPITTVKSVTASESITTVKPVTTSEPITTVKSVITSQPITTVKSVTTIEPIINLSKPIISTGKPNYYTPNVDYPPVNVIRLPYQMPLPDQNVYYQPIPYHIWYNNYHSQLNQPVSYQPNNEYLPYPMTIPNSYESKPLTYNNMPYTGNNYQNYETHYPLASQQISSTSKPEQIGDMSHYTYGNPNPAYNQYPILYNTVPQMVRSDIPKNMVFPRSYSMKTTEPTAVYSTKQLNGFEPRLMTRIGAERQKNQEETNLH